MRSSAGSAVFRSAHTAPGLTCSAAARNASMAAEALLTLRTSSALLTASASSVQSMTPSGAVTAGS